MAIKKIQMRPPMTGHTDINHPETDSTMVLMGDSRTLEVAFNAHLLENVSVKDYGAKGNANYFKIADSKWYQDAGYTILSNDDTIAIQTAINESSKIYFPKGNYLVSSITLPVEINRKYLHGDYQASVIIAKNPTGDVFNFTAGLVVIQDLKFSCAVPRTSGAYITLANAWSFVDRCYFDSGFLGIKISASLTSISNCDFRDFSNNGIIIQINGGYNVYLDHIRADNPTTVPLAGINITSAGDVTITNSNIIRCGNDLYVNPGNGQVVASIYADNTFFDTAITGINLSAIGTGAIVRSHFINCWTSGHSTNGVNMSTDATGLIDGITFNNLQSNGNTNSGVQLSTGNINNIYFLGGEMSANGGAAFSIGNNMHKFYLYNMLIGNVCGLGSGNAYGIYIGTGCTDYEVGNCVVEGNTAPVVDNSKTGKIFNCKGYKTSADGVATILSGSTNIYFNHGLNIIPTLNKISVTPTNWMGNATKFYIVVPNSTQIQIIANVDPGAATATFAWQVRD